MTTLRPPEPTTADTFAEQSEVPPTASPASPHRRLAAMPSKRATINRVGVFMAERDEERTQVFSTVLAYAGYIITLGICPLIAILVMDLLNNVISDTVFYYVYCFSYLVIGSGMMVMSTLPPSTFDFDDAMDGRPTARRALTIALLLSAVANGMGSPYICLGAAVGFTVKLFWDELVVGCCNHPGRPRMSCCSRNRPGLSDVITYCYFGAIGLHFGVRYIQMGLCHAAAAERTPSSMFNTSAAANNVSDLLSNTTVIANATACGTSINK
jgi:hypothetical protein